MKIFLILDLNIMESKTRTIPKNMLNGRILGVKNNVTFEIGCPKSLIGDEEDSKRPFFKVSCSLGSGKKSEF